MYLWTPLLLVSFMMIDPAPISVSGAIVIEFLSVALTPMNNSFRPSRGPDHHVRRDEAVIVDHRVVADVIAAPQRHVVADRHERLNRVVFEDEGGVDRR